MMLGNDLVSLTVHCSLHIWCRNPGERIPFGVDASTCVLVSSLFVIKSMQPGYSLKSNGTVNRNCLKDLVVKENFDPVGFQLDQRTK